MIENLANSELERNLLSSIIQTDNFSEISELVREEHFTLTGHIAILNAIKILDEKSTPLNLVVVAEEVMKIDGEQIGILKLVGAETAVTDLKITVVQLVEWHNKREIFRLSIQMQEDLKINKSSSSIVKKMDDVTINLDVSIGTRAKTYEEWETIIENSPPLPVFATGVSFIDNYLQGGPTGGQLILVMGDPEAGKTLLTTQILHNVSNGFPVLFFPFEFTVRDYVNNNKKRKKNINKKNLYIVNEGYDLSDVSREIKIWAKKGVRFVAIDSQMRVENTENRGTAEQMESEKFSRLAKLAHSLELVILFIAQQGKEDSKGGVHSPMGSKKGAHEASQIWFLHKQKPKYENGSDIDINAHKRELEVSKNKQNGRHFRTEISLNPVLLEFHRKYQKGDDPMPSEVVTFESNKKKNEEVIVNVEIPDEGLL